MKKKTRDRILETSLKLFNEHGFSATSTARIAEEAGISEGNLWYHFRTKSDLVAVLFDQLATRIEERLAIASTPETVLDAYLAFNKLIFQEMRDYQFLYRDPTEVGRQSPDMERRVREIYKASIERTRTFFLHMIEAGHLDLSPDEVPMLADNVWIVVRYWPDFLYEARNTLVLTPEVLAEGMRQHMALFDHNLTPQARAYLHERALHEPAPVAE